MCFHCHSWIDLILHDWNKKSCYRSNQQQSYSDCYLSPCSLLLDPYLGNLLFQLAIPLQKSPLCFCNFEIYFFLSSSEDEPSFVLLENIVYEVHLDMSVDLFTYIVFDLDICVTVGAFVKSKGSWGQRGTLLSKIILAFTCMIIRHKIIIHLHVFLSCLESQLLFTLGCVQKILLYYRREIVKSWSCTLKFQRLIDAEFLFNLHFSTVFRSHYTLVFTFRYHKNYNFHFVLWNNNKNLEKIRPYFGSLEFL